MQLCSDTSACIRLSSRNHRESQTVIEKSIGLGQGFFGGGEGKALSFEFSGVSVSFDHETKYRYKDYDALIS